MRSVGGMLIYLPQAVRPQVDKPLVCDAWPMQCQTYGYVPSCRASPPLDLQSAPNYTVW